jgi:hypothetical protein
VAMPAAVVARVLVELYVGWVKMYSRSGGRLVLAELNVGKRSTMRKARNRYYRDSCGFKFPTRVLGLAEPLCTERKGRFTLPILRPRRSVVAHASGV